MNAERMDLLAARVLEDHKHYNQGEWCGTQGCLAGHAAVLAGFNVVGDNAEPTFIDEIGGVRKIAQEWLGLDEVQSADLFDWHWPKELEDAYEDAEDCEDTLGMAQVAVTAINHFKQEWSA